ncbi:unnamed protein product [Durusdinium trenchii]|uniref:Uncharacterized protein n=1 Tax=Durusdinium trenchii TaxID=1381693 RepID=A0ABP0QMG4_9DINO
MMQRQPTVEIAQPTVPEGFKAGDRLQATFPNGESIMISIPEGAAPFDGLWIEVRRGRWVPARAAKWLFKSLLFTLGCGLVFAGFGLMRCPIHWLLWVLCCLLTCCFCLCAHTNGGKACNIFATWTCLGCPILGLLALVRQLFLCDPEHDMGIDDGPYLAIPKDYAYYVIYGILCPMLICCCVGTFSLFACAWRRRSELELAASMPAIKRGAGKIEEYANKFKNMNQNHNDFEGSFDYAYGSQPEIYIEKFGVETFEGQANDLLGVASCIDKYDNLYDFDGNFQGCRLGIFCRVYHLPPIKYMVRDGREKFEEAAEELQPVARKVKEYVDKMRREGFGANFEGKFWNLEGEYAINSAWKDTEAFERKAHRLLLSYHKVEEYADKMRREGLGEDFEGCFQKLEGEYAINSAWNNTDDFETKADRAFGPIHLWNKTTFLRYKPRVLED